MSHFDFLKETSSVLSNTLSFFQPLLQAGYTEGTLFNDQKDPKDENTKSGNNGPSLKINDNCLSLLSFKDNNDLTFWMNVLQI